MMSDEIKIILAKKPEDIADDERATLEAAIDSFKEAVNNVCQEHGLAYKAIIHVTKEGVTPLLDIVSIKEDEETK